MKSKRSPLIEFKQIKQKDNSYTTTSNCKNIPITSEDGKELFKRMQLIYQLRTQGHDYCKKCSDKGKCVGCIWNQIDYHILSAETLVSSLMELINVAPPEEPLWEKEEKEEKQKAFIRKLVISGLMDIVSPPLEEEDIQC